jgi:hypothetical protein
MTNPETEAAGAASPASTLPERSDAMMSVVLGHDLMGATWRLGLYLLVVGIVLASIAALVR